MSSAQNTAKKDNGDGEDGKSHKTNSMSTAFYKLSRELHKGKQYIVCSPDVYSHDLVYHIPGNQSMVTTVQMAQCIKGKITPVKHTINGKESVLEGNVIRQGAVLPSDTDRINRKEFGKKFGANEISYVRIGSHKLGVTNDQYDATIAKLFEEAARYPLIFPCFLLCINNKYFAVVMPSSLRDSFFTRQITFVRNRLKNEVNGTVEKIIDRPVNVFSMITNHDNHGTQVKLPFIPFLASETSSDDIHNVLLPQVKPKKNKETDDDTTCASKKSSPPNRNAAQSKKKIQNGLAAVIEAAQNNTVPPVNNDYDDESLSENEAKEAIQYGIDDLSKKPRNNNNSDDEDSAEDDEPDDDDKKFINDSVIKRKVTKHTPTKDLSSKFNMKKPPIVFGDEDSAEEEDYVPGSSASDSDDESDDISSAESDNNVDNFANLDTVDISSKSEMGGYTRHIPKKTLTSIMGDNMHEELFEPKCDTLNNILAHEFNQDEIDLLTEIRLKQDRLKEKGIEIKPFATAENIKNPASFSSEEYSTITKQFMAFVYHHPVIMGAIRLLEERLAILARQNDDQSNRILVLESDDVLHRKEIETLTAQLSELQKKLDDEQLVNVGTKRHATSHTTDRQDVKKKPATQISLDDFI